MYGTFRSGHLSLGSFGALCKISDLKIFKRLLLPQFSSIFNQTLHRRHVHVFGGNIDC